jgi:chemotaxis protein histidine kinase CheA
MRGVIRWTVFLLLAAVLDLSPCAGGERGAVVRPKTEPAGEMGLGNYHAVLIGINGYQSLPKLKTPINDVEAIAELLKRYYGFEDITLVTDKSANKPTASEIVKTLRNKSRELTASDNLLVYYAGHGNIDELTKEGYWIPIDGKADDPTTWIPHSLIRNLLETEKVKVKNFLLVADSCYSGTMMRRSLHTDTIADEDEGALFQKLKERAGKKSREVITSGGNEPVADEAIGSDHSLFAYYMIKALENNQKRYTDVATLFSLKVQPMVDQRGKQRPDRSRVQSVSDEDGLFVLARLSVAEGPRKPTVQEEMARITRENEKIRLQLEEERFNTAQKDAALAKLAEEKRLKEKETERIQNTLAEERQKGAAERARLLSEKKELVAEKSRLESLASKNKAEEARVSSQLAQNSAELSEHKLAEMEQQQLRLQEAKAKIAEESAKVQERERLQAQVEERFKKEEQARVKSEREQLARLEQIKTEAAKLEQQKEIVQAQRLKSEQELHARMVETEKARIELDKRAREVEALVEGGRSLPVSDANGRFLNLEQVVIDTKTRLMWLKNANEPVRGMDMDEALKYVDNFSFQGYRDWRIPTREDWKELIDKPGGLEGSYPGGHPFSNIVSHANYWTSSVNPMGLSHAYVINVAKGSVSISKKSNIGFVWPVRDVSLAELKKAQAASAQAGKK